MTALLALLLAALPGRSELAAGDGVAAAAVSGPVQLQLRASGAAVEVVAGAPGTLRISADGERVVLLGAGSRVEAQFSGRQRLRRGSVRVELPPGSSVDLSTVSGATTVRDLRGDVRVRGMSGPVEVRNAAAADVETIDGKVHVAGASGAVRVHTVSGAIAVESAAPLQAEIETSSGPVEVRGPCARGCHVDVDGVSGPLLFAFDPKSAFGFKFVSHTGKLIDQLGLGGKQKTAQGDDAWIEAAYGAADGVVECETFSSDVTLRGLP